MYNIYIYIYIYNIAWQSTTTTIASLLLLIDFFSYAELRLNYYKIGGVYDLLWGNTSYMLEFTTLEQDCGLWNDTYNTLIEMISVKGESLLSRVAEVEG